MKKPKWTFWPTQYFLYNTTDTYLWVLRKKKKRERENCLNDRNIEIIQRKLLKTEGYWLYKLKEVTWSLTKPPKIYARVSLLWNVVTMETKPVQDFTENESGTQRMNDISIELHKRNIRNSKHSFTVLKRICF